MAAIEALADVYQGLARAGRGAGARAGDWKLRVVESRDLRDDRWPQPDSLQEIKVARGVRTERHLLRPFDVLVTARSGSVQVALVPPGVSRTVAGVTLLVARPREPASGMGHWLWYFLTSAFGREQLARRLTVTASLRSLSAGSLGGVEVPVPSARDLDALALIVDASETAYAETMEAALLRRWALRDSVVHEFRLRAMAAS